jgi:hypothetical protein
MRSRAWENMCSEPEEGREFPAMDMETPDTRTGLIIIHALSSSVGLMWEELSRITVATILLSTAAEVEYSSCLSRWASSQSMTAVMLEITSAQPAASRRQGDLMMMLVSATTPMGTDAVKERFSGESLPRIEALGDVMPSWAAEVGTEMKGHPVWKAASLATSILLPPPTPTRYSASSSTARVLTWATASSSAGPTSMTSTSYAASTSMSATS